MIWKGTVQLIDFDHAGDSDSASLRKEGLPDNQKFNTGGSLKAPRALRND